MTPADELGSHYASKALAELARTDAGAGFDVVPSSGDPLAPILVLKGLPGPAEASGGGALSGADGEALKKALAALGQDLRWFAVVTRPAGGEASEEEISQRVLEVTEAIDPSTVLVLDSSSLQDFRRAYARHWSEFEKIGTVRGRRIVAVDGLEASLDDPSRKRKVWRGLKKLA